jgi:hypothetical protein
MKYKDTYLIIGFLSLACFVGGKFKIFLNFTLLDLSAVLIALFLILFSIINLFFLKKKNYAQITLILIFFLFFFQISRLNQFNFSDLSKEQRCTYKNIEYEQNKNNEKIKNEYLSACKIIRN